MLNKLFSLRSNEVINYRHEIMGGVANFLAIAYIIIVNPLILNANGAGFPMDAAITSTVLLIVIMTIIAGFYIKLPFVLAPGMGVNAIVAYNFILHDKMDVPTVLGVILFSSILLFIFSVTKIRQLIIKAIPEFLQIALTAGIGVFLVFIGLKNSGLIVAKAGTLIGVGHVTWQMILPWLGFLLAAVLFIRGKVYAFLLPIILITIISLILNPAKIPTSLVKMPDFSLFMQIDVLKALQLSLLPAIISLFVVNFFDATSTVLGLIGQLKFNSPSEKSDYLRRSLVCDSAGGALASLIGSSPSVIFVESSVAIQAGARTGLASVITALICIPFIFLAPLIEIVPLSSTAPALILVGCIMLLQLRNLKVSEFEDMLACAIIVIMMPLSFSIAAGAIFGIVSYVLLKILLGKYRQLPLSLIIIALACCSWFYLGA